MSSDGFLFSSDPAVRSRDYQGLILVITALVGLLMMMVVASGLLREILVLMVAIVGVAAVWRWPALAATFLVAFTPVNRFVVFLGFYFVPNQMVLQATQLWKDAIIIVLLARVLHEALERRRAPTVYLLDIIAGAFLMLNLIYVLYPGTLENNDVIGRMLGFRLDAYFVFGYFVGRGLSLSKHQLQWIMLGIIPGSIAVALVAAWQWVFPGWANDLWNTLGYQAFVDAVNGSSDIAVRTRDLGGMSIPRSSSLLMGDLALAFYQLLLVPIAAAFLIAQRNKTTLGWQILAGGFLLLMLATMAFSGARSAMVAIPVSLLVIAVWSRSWGYAIAGGALILPLLAAFLIILSTTSTGDFFSSLFSTEEGSTVAHVDAMERGLEIIQHEPLGRGLGTSHTVGYQRGTETRLATESWYLQIGVETGIMGMALYTLLIVGATLAALLAYHRVTDPWLRALTLGVGGAGVGFLLVGFVLHVWEAPVIAAVFWILAGIAARAPQFEQQWAQQERAAA